MNAERTSTDRVPHIAGGHSLISHAVALMRHCSGYMFDQQQAEQDGWKVFYAVDVDVITLYMAPSAKSDYAAVFGEGEDPDTRELLARLIGDFIFRQIKSTADVGDQGNGCLFIISPHDEELRRMLFALSNKVLGAVDAVEKLLEHVLTDLHKPLADGDHAELAQWLIDNAQLLVEIFDGESGSRSELERFAALDERRLLHVARYTEKQGSWTFPLPLQEGKPEDLKIFTELYDTWKKRLLKHKAPKQTRRNLARDAYVMATVEWLNQRMAAEKRRIVLVTGTRAILDAASNYRPPVAKGDSKNFAELYVRHPQAFMVDNGFFPEIPAKEESDGIKNFRLFDWLNLFFPEVILEGEKQVASIDTTQLKRIEKGGDKEFQEAINLFPDNDKIDLRDSILNEWRTQVRNACVSREINTAEARWPERAKGLLARLKNKLDQGLTVEQLQSELASRAFQSLNVLYLSTAWLGSWSQVNPITAQVRGIPALRFNSRNKTPVLDYRDTVVAAMKSGANSSHINIAEMYSELLKVDDSNYHAHVIHALAYATKGHWHATKTLCKIALRTVAELPKDKRGYRRGREAAYLLAISERRSARTVDDLKDARKYLGEAQSTERNPDASSKDLRFLSEAIAIDVAQINFDYFLGGGVPAIPAAFERIWQEASELFSKLESEQQPKCKEWIHQQLSTNILDLALILYDVNHDFPEVKRGQVRDILSGLREKRSKQEPMKFNDTVFEFIFLTATAVFCPETAGDVDVLEKLDKLVFHASLPFDQSREKVFRRLAERRA